MAFLLVLVITGGKKPLEVPLTCSMALEFGAVVLPTFNCAFSDVEPKIIVRAAKTNILLFITVIFYFVFLLKIFNVRKNASDKFCGGGYPIP